MSFKLWFSPSFPSGTLDMATRPPFFNNYIITELPILATLRRRVHACFMEFMFSLHDICWRRRFFKENQEKPVAWEPWTHLLAFELFLKLARRSLSFLLVTKVGSPWRVQTQKGRGSLNRPLNSPGGMIFHQEQMQPLFRAELTGIKLFKVKTLCLFPTQTHISSSPSSKVARNDTQVPGTKLYPRETLRHFPTMETKQKLRH